MLQIYCGAQHDSPGRLCVICSDLLTYATSRILKCPIRIDKPPCENCVIHCYKSDFRALMKSVMRFSGPRMLYSHPIFAINHLFAKLRFKRKQKQTTAS